LDLHFHIDLPVRQLGGAVDKRKLSTPRLMFDNPRLLALASLLAEECTGAGSHDLYGESLITAMLVELFGAARMQGEGRGGLTPLRLRTAKDYLETNCFHTGQLAEIADMLGLSQSYFCSAFRASTGLTPHQWLMRTRIDKVKSMLKERNSRLSEVASMAGFSDQAHMTRVFKQYVGVTPAAWVQQQAGNALLDRQKIQATAKSYKRLR
jgi:AraC-like DNA-binding protein